MSDEECTHRQPESVDVMGESDPEFFASFDALYTTTWSSGAIPAKYKELFGVAISVVMRCRPCATYHIRMCLKESANRDELLEAIRLGVLTGGSVSIPDARYAYSVLKDRGVV
jgi:AhpD family alkylhydroperoxidase